MNRFTLVALSIALFGCPATPKIVNIQNGDERQMNCQQLSFEMEAARRAKVEAHAEDHFRASDIFPPTGAISVARIWRADSHATERLELLKRIADEKGCADSRSHSSISNQEQIVLAQYVPQHMPVVTQQIQVEEKSGNNLDITTEKPHDTSSVEKQNEPAMSEDEELSRDQDAIAYIEKGYDSEVFLRVTPGGHASSY